MSSAKQVAGLADAVMIDRAPAREPATISSFNHYSYSSPHNDHYDRPRSHPVALNPDHYRSVPNLSRRRLASPPSPPAPPLPMRTSFRMAVDHAYHFLPPARQFSPNSDVHRDVGACFRNGTSANYIDMELKSATQDPASQSSDVNPYADPNMFDINSYVNYQRQDDALVVEHGHKRAHYGSLNLTYFSEQNYEPMYALLPENMTHAQTTVGEYENVGASNQPPATDDVTERDYLAFATSRDRMSGRQMIAISEESIYASIADPTPSSPPPAPRPMTTTNSDSPTGSRPLAFSSDWDLVESNSRPWYSGTDTGSEQVSSKPRW